MVRSPQRGEASRTRAARVAKGACQDGRRAIADAPFARRAIIDGDGKSP
jgi:hypothetical protein